MTSVEQKPASGKGQAKVAFEKILVPLDGSDIASGILPIATDLASRIGAKIDLFAVIDPETVELPSYVPMMSGESAMGDTGADSPRADEVEMMRIKAATGYLNRLAEGIRQDGLKVGVEAVVGDPAESIIDAARSRRSELIAMATRGRSAIARGLLGSVTDKVAHSSPVPMLIVATRADAPPQPISRIIVGLDGSPMAEIVLEPARRLALALDVPILMLQATAVAARMAAYGGEPYFASADLYTEADEEAQAYLDRLKTIEEQRGITVETVLRPGSAVAELQNAASERPGSLIMLATRGRTGLTRWVLGSVTDRVIRSTDGPVLVIPPRVGGWD